MKVDMIGFGIRVVLKNTGKGIYLSYPRDVEGTIIGATIDTARARMKVMEGNYRGLFDVANLSLNIHVRWDNDNKGWYSTQSLHVRSFGRCPGYDSLWSDEEYNLDTRPFSALKPISRPALKRSTRDSFFDAVPNIKWSLEPSEELTAIVDEITTKITTKRPKKAKYRTTAETYKGHWVSYLTSSTS